MYASLCVCACVPACVFGLFFFFGGVESHVVMRIENSENDRMFCTSSIPCILLMKTILSVVYNIIG